MTATREKGKCPITVLVNDDLISCHLPVGHRGEHRGFNLKGDLGIIWSNGPGGGGVGYGPSGGLILREKEEG